MRTPSSVAVDARARRRRHTAVGSFVVVAAGLIAGCGRSASSARVAPAFETTTCADAAQQLAQSRPSRQTAAAISRPTTAPLSSFIPRNPPHPDWGSEWMGGPAPDVTTLPAGTVGEARTSLAPNGLEDSFIRGFRQPTDGSRVFYAVYRFASANGTVNVEDAAVTRACQHDRDYVSTRDGVLGTSAVGPRGDTLSLLFARNGLLFDFHANSPKSRVPDETKALAARFFAAAAAADLGPGDAPAVARTAASTACGRLRYLADEGPYQKVTEGELREAALEAGASITNPADDADAQAVSDSIAAFVGSIILDESVFTTTPATVERAAELDNVCRGVTGQGVFRG